MTCHPGIEAMVLAFVLTVATQTSADETPLPAGGAPTASEADADSALVARFANQADLYLLRLRLRGLAATFGRAADSLNVVTAAATADSMRVLAHRLSLRIGQLTGVSHEPLLRWIERDAGLHPHFFADHAFVLGGNELLGTLAAQFGSTGVPGAAARPDPAAAREPADSTEGFVDRVVRNAPTVVTWALGVWATYEATEALRD